jgi:hypothetical protein
LTSRGQKLLLAAGMGKPTRNELLAEYYLRAAGVAAAPNQHADQECHGKWVQGYLAGPASQVIAPSRFLAAVQAGMGFPRLFPMLLDLSFVTLDRFSVVRRGPLEIVDLLLQELPLTKTRCEVAGRTDDPLWSALRSARLFGTVHKAPVRSP